MPQFTKPQLLSHYSIWSEPPDANGDEVLRIASTQRALKLKGHSFREFERHVVPLLDGTHTLDEIHARTEGIFRPEDLDSALDMLGHQGVVVEARGDSVAAGHEPQANFMQDLGLDAAAVQRRLSAATVAVVGLGPMGAETTSVLAAAGVGRIVAIDPDDVTVADAAMSSAFRADDVTRPRAGVLAGAMARRHDGQPWATDVVASMVPVEDEGGLSAAIAEAELVVCCLDPGLVNLQYKLNKVCQREGRTWVSAHQDGPSVVVGPTVVPGETACFMCYRMRTIACSGNPESAFAYERHLDRTKRDLGESRQSLVFAVGLAANHLGLETVKLLTEFTEPALSGRVLTIDLITLRTRKHTVLRKPWCPVCSGGMDAN